MTEEQFPRSDKSKALLIASREFRDSSLPQLGAVMRTAALLDKTLREPKVWHLPFPSRLVVDASGEGLSHAEILGTVKDISQQAEDAFVLYYAGHGHDENGRLWLPLHDSDMSSTATMLAFEDLVNAISSRARLRLVLLDCCHAGQAMKDLRMGQYVAGQESSECYVIAACSGNRQAKSPEGHELTAFGHALISCLKVGGSPEEEFLTPKSVFDGITAWLGQKGYPLPVSNNAPSGGLPWVMNRAYAPVVQKATFPTPSTEERKPGTAGEALYLGLGPAPLPDPFIGRDKLLAKARVEVRPGQLLPVTGHEGRGKSALLSHLLAEWDKITHLALPPAILEIDPNPAAERPLTEAITRALRQTLDDGDLPTTPESRVEDLLEVILPRIIKGRALVVVIKASGIDLKVPLFRQELDDLLTRPVFRGAAVLMESLEPVDADTQGRWRRRAPLWVRELDTDAAKELIEAFLKAEHLRTDPEKIEFLEDDLTRGPDVIETAALQISQAHQQKDDFDRFLAGHESSEDAEEWVEPQTFSLALIEAAYPAVVNALRRTWPAYPHAWSQGQSALVMWALLNDFALSLGTLENLGLSRDVLRVLFNEKIIVQSRGSHSSDRLLEIGLAARKALKEDLRTAVHSAEVAGTVDTYLTKIAKLLVTTVLAAYARERGTQAPTDVPPLMEALRRATGWMDHTIPDALPKLRSRCGDYANGAYPDALLLPVAQRASAPEDTSAAEDTEPPEKADPSEVLGELYAVAGRLNVDSRAAPDERTTKAFVADFGRATLLMEGLHEVPLNVLRAIDQCGFHGARRHQAFERILPARVRLVERLVASHEAEERNPLRAIWSLSWIMNTAVAQGAAGDEAGAQQSIETAEVILRTLPDARDIRDQQTRNWLSFRLARLRCASAATVEERRAAQLEAYELAEESVLSSSEVPERQHQWTNHLLTTGFHYALVIRDDRERLALARRTLTTLERSWGPRSQWPLFLTVRTAFLLRNIHERHADCQLQYSGAREVLDLLGTGAGRPEREGSPYWQADHWVELARTYLFLAHVQQDRNERSGARASLEEGVRTVQRALHRHPSVYAYKAWLRLLRTKQAWYGEPPGQPLMADYAEAVTRVRAWLVEQEASGHGSEELAVLDLWCIESDWRRRGSLPVAARSIPVPVGMESGSAELWRMGKVYKQRQKTLKIHRERFGPSWDLYEVEFRLLRQHQRWSATYGKHPLKVNHTPVWDLLDEAKCSLPGSLDVARARARYHRYIWQYAEAARLFGEVARKERDGDKFRTALTDAAECLLSQALYDDKLSAEGITTALRTASGFLEEVMGCHIRAHEVALLKARVDLELGNPVDWRLADSKRVDLIGDDYLKQVGEILNAPQRHAQTNLVHGEPAEESGTSYAMDVLLEEHFTDIQVLKHLGMLYFRRSVLENTRGETEAALDSSWRAYNCFDGARFMEESGLSGRREEWAGTAFLRGQVITWACEIAASPAPFPRECEDNRGWIGLAFSRLQSSRDRSVGKFYELIKQWEKRLHDLQ
ncbi:caspase family protein [Streptomyces scabiei]|uniref:caspase family protein n=1 Tax=Streptomyces scabiei TaxID=1930 RepID=UPI0038F74ED0